MRRTVSVICLVMLMAGIKAQVRDAFDGILPVTDPQMKQSLNGEWQLKVVHGISDDLTVPIADETWGRIPVPGCWEVPVCWSVPACWASPACPATCSVAVDETPDTILSVAHLRLAIGFHPAPTQGSVTLWNLL